MDGKCGINPYAGPYPESGHPTPVDCPRCGAEFYTSQCPVCNDNQGGGGCIISREAKK